ncbi:MAG: hypothetical protein WBF33_25330 [Candidatus Nitrosopolaris sp.]|jgi:hypothetical protein
MKTIYLIAIGLSIVAIVSGVIIFQTYSAAETGATTNQKQQNLASNVQQNHPNTGQDKGSNNGIGDGDGD